MPQAHLLSSFTLNMHGCEIDIPIRYSLKAKRIFIRINLEKVELVLPKKANLNIAHLFLQKHELWIRKKLAQNKVPKNTLEEGQMFIFGEIYKIKYKISKKNNVHIAAKEITIEEKEGKHHEFFKAYLKEALLEKILKLANAISTRYNLNYTKINIRNTLGRWGSCSSKKHLSFSLKLSLAPHNIIEYVVAHEMAHLKEMNHSKKFWKLVEEIYPEYKNARLWLKHNSKMVNSMIRNLK